MVMQEQAIKEKVKDMVRLPWQEILKAAVCLLSVAVVVVKVR
jgi:hypothetical protein